MQTIERRLAALEDSASDKTLKVVVVLDGETKAEALMRLGLTPDAVHVVYLSQIDEWL